MSLQNRPWPFVPPSGTFHIFLQSAETHYAPSESVRGLQDISSMCNLHDDLKHLGISLARPPDAIEQIGAIVHLSVTYKNKAEYEILENLAYGLSLGELEAIMVRRNITYIELRMNEQQLRMHCLTDRQIPHSSFVEVIYNMQEHQLATSRIALSPSQEKENIDASQGIAKDVSSASQSSTVRIPLHHKQSIREANQQEYFERTLETERQRTLTAEHESQELRSRAAVLETILEAEGEERASCQELLNKLRLEHAQTETRLREELDVERYRFLQIYRDLEVCQQELKKENLGRTKARVLLDCAEHEKAEVKTAFDDLKLEMKKAVAVPALLDAFIRISRLTTATVNIL